MMEEEPPINQMAAAKDELEGTGYREIQFRDLTLLVKYEPDRYLEMAEAFESGNGATILRVLLGEEQYRKVRALQPGVSQEEATMLSGRIMAVKAAMRPGES